MLRTSLKFELDFLLITLECRNLTNMDSTLSVQEGICSQPRQKILRLLRGWTAFVGARTFIKCKHFPQHKINVLQLFMDDIFCLPNSNCSAFTVQGHFGGTDVAFSGSLNFCSYCCLLNGSCLEVLTCLSTDKKHRSCLKKSIPNMERVEFVPRQ